MAGRIPRNLGQSPNLTAVSLRNNYLSGDLPSGFTTVRFLDLSSNLINGSLRSDFGGDSLAYLNVSYNRLSGAIPPAFADRIPVSAVVDLSFNRLEGPVPESQVFSNQKPTHFSGNPTLCGEQARKPCPAEIPPAPTSPPAIAAIPKTINSDPSATPGSKKRTGLRPAKIAYIVAGDIAGVAILSLLFLYAYRAKKRSNKKRKAAESEAEGEDEYDEEDSMSSSSSSASESRRFTRWSCLRKNTGEEEEEKRWREEGPKREVGTLVTVDGENDLELETLLKASAYILGATGSSIMYKAVLDDGTALAVRRIGESGVDRFKDFENRVRIVAKLVHPNLVRVRGFYWGVDEKLIIYDFLPNGSLANARYSQSLLFSSFFTRFFFFSFRVFAGFC